MFDDSNISKQDYDVKYLKLLTNVTILVFVYSF